MNESTSLYSVDEINNKFVSRTIDDVYALLEEKGYNAVNQIVGYLISGDPGYISGYKDARGKISMIERDKIVEFLLRNYLDTK